MGGIYREEMWFNISLFNGYWVSREGRCFKMLMNRRFLKKF